MSMQYKPNILLFIATKCRSRCVSPGLLTIFLLFTQTLFWKYPLQQLLLITRALLVVQLHGPVGARVDRRVHGRRRGRLRFLGADNRRKRVSGLVHVVAELQRDQIAPRTTAVPLTRALPATTSDKYCYCFRVRLVKTKTPRERKTDRYDVVAGDTFRSRQRSTNSTGSR